MLDKIIINGTVIDGTGAQRRTGTVGIKDGKLIMDPVDTLAHEVIDAAGKIVCPGFIDAHSHGDVLLGSEDGRLFKTVQGVTTELCGNCGSSYAPLPENRQEEIYHALPYTHPFEEVKKWTTFERFLQRADRMDLSANARFYMGHNLLRRIVMGTENRPANKAELENGMSTGLIYVPGCYCSAEEPLELAKVVAEYGGIYASHMRNESDHVVDALEEVLDVGRQTGVRLNISHHKVQGRKNWGKQKITLEMIQKANEEGTYTTCDLYPFTRAMNNITSCVPPWHLSEGKEALAERLKDPCYRRNLRQEMSSPETEYENFYLNSGGWDGVYIADTIHTPEAEGKFVSEYASAVGKDPFDAYFDLLIANNGWMQGVYSTISEDDLYDIVRSPYCVIGSDGITRSWKDKGHPRASATFPKAIELFVKEKKVLTLEEMVRKMTGLTAERLQVANKGLLKSGYDADVLILDYENMKVLATYDAPNQKSEGIDCVIVGGRCVYRNMEMTGVYSGEVIRFK